MKNKLNPYIEKDIILSPICKFIKEYPRFVVWVISLIILIITNFWFFNNTNWIDMTDKPDIIIWITTQGNVGGWFVLLVIADVIATLSILVFFMDVSD